MASNLMQRHRPKDASAGAIRTALEGLHGEHTVIRQQIETDTARRSALLLSGTEKEIAAAEASIRDARLNAERIDALASDLKRQLVDAIAEEAAAAHAEKVRDACGKIEAFNNWLATIYTPHAEAIAAGVAMERQALQAIEALRDPATRVVTAGLPTVGRAYVGKDGRGLGFLTRLPAAQPGQAAIVWP